MARHVRQNIGLRDATTHGNSLARVGRSGGAGPTRTGFGHDGWTGGWSMVFSRQRRTSWTEAIFYRQVLHRSVGDARFFLHVGSNVQRARAAWRDGGGGVGPTRTGSSHDGWSMVFSWQRRTS
jgi:hypothetical protein